MKQPERFIRIIGLCGALGGLYISILFSARGLAFTEANLSLGWALAIFASCIQLVGNQRSAQRNSMLMVACFLAYAYSITTNIIGIVAGTGLTFTQAIQAKPEAVLVGVLFGFMIDIAPEPLIMWAMIGQASESSFILIFSRHILNGVARVLGRAAVQNQPPRSQQFVQPGMGPAQRAQARNAPTYRSVAGTQPKQQQQQQHL